ncbi:hypothetical protein ABPG74_013404 [Tetrahymena malaccensis]
MEIEQLRPYQVDYDKFKSHFEFIENGTSIAFGDYKVMKNVETGQLVLIKPQETNSLQETEELLTTIQDINIRLNQCPYFLQFLGFTEVPPEDRITELNSSGRKLNQSVDQNLIYLVFEYFKDTIEQLWPTISRSGEEKIEELLKRLSASMTQSFATLELIGQAHTDVSLQNIICYKSETDGLHHFKLIYSQYTTSAFRQVMDFQQNQSNYFLAPEIREKLDSKVRSSTGLDPQKIDVYAFGQMILFLANFKDESLDMNMKQNLRDPAFTTKLLNFVKNNYSHEFYYLINQMIDNDNHKRPTFQMISFRLQHINFYKTADDRNWGTNYSQQGNGSNSKVISPQLQSQLNHLEKKPLIERAQEIRQEIFSTKRNLNGENNHLPYRRHDRSVSHNQNISNYNGASKYGNGSQISYFTPGRLNHQKKTSNQLTPGSQQRFSYSPVSHSPYQRRVNNVSVHPNQAGGNIYQSQYGHGFRNDNQSNYSRQSPYNNQSKSKMYNQELYNQEFFEKMLQELEKNLIIDDNLNLKTDVVRKEYQDGSVYIGEIGFNELGQEVRQGKGIYYYKNFEGNKIYTQLVPLSQFGEVYAGDWKNNLFDGNGVYLFSSGERYEGELQEGQKSGKGTYFYSNGNQYEGDWYDDMKNGYGHFYFNNIGERYEGEFQNGQRHGHGTYVFSNGDIFIGQWYFGEKNGKGEVQFVDGSRFEGEWKANQPNGYGKMLYQNGDIYEGNFTCGIKEGEGIYIHKMANSKYQGTFKVDEPQGYGQFLYANNDVYEGEIKSGQRHGRGVYTYINGDKYEGEWKFDKKSGYGVFSFSDGSLYEGQWSMGQIKGQGQMQYGQISNKYLTFLEKNKNYKNSNGDYYKGEWLKDKKHGKGYYKWATGDSYKGDWRNDKMNGKGIFISRTGQTFSGMWNDNKLVAKI